MPTEKRFYLPASDEKLIQDLTEILKREGKSLSQWIRDQARPYVDLHSSGNPQQRLDVIMKTGKPYRANECGACGNYPKIFGIQKNGESILLCDECFDKEKLRLQGWRKLN